MDGETVAKFCQALAHTKSSERIGEARDLPCSLLCRRTVDGSYGFAVPKLCGRIVDGRYGFAAPNLCGRVVDSSCGCAAPNLSRRFGDGSYGFAAPKLCRRIGTVANALQCQWSALSSEQARRPWLRLALSKRCARLHRKTRRRTDYSHQKQYWQHSDQQNDNNLERIIGRKTTLWTL